MSPAEAGAEAMRNPPQNPIRMLFFKEFMSISIREIREQSKRADQNHAPASAFRTTALKSPNA
jgi:hypothetical protein